MKESELCAVPISPPLSDGEIDFLWWFMQGSIMDAEVREHLRDGWGMCERHSFAMISVEAAFRPHHPHGPAIVYNELMAHAWQALGAKGPLAHLRCQHSLRTAGPCHLCRLGINDSSPGHATPERLAIARDVSSLRRWMNETESFWLAFVCGRCLGQSAHALCRPHLLAELDNGNAEVIEQQRHFVQTLHSHLRRFEKSFEWEYRAMANPLDRGALIAAIGWCSGWRTLLHAYRPDTYFRQE